MWPPPTVNQYGEPFMKPVVVDRNDFVTDKSKTVVITGHRPGKFPFKNDSIRLNMLKSMIYERINRAIENGYDTFLVGMAEGVDIWAGLIVISLRELYPHIKLVGVAPYFGEEKSRKGTDIWDYNLVRDGCNTMVYLYGSKEEFDSLKKSGFLERDRYMVDRASLIVGAVVHERGRGGSVYTIKYARSKNLKEDIIHLENMREIFQF